MALLVTKRSVMTLFSDSTHPLGHRARVVLAEKGIAAEVHFIDDSVRPEDLFELNPYGSLPTLADRDLILYDSRVIMEYLDERFPHPPLMPIDPAARARTRLCLYRIERDWYSLIDDLESRNEKRMVKARKSLRDGLIASNDVFAAKPFFLSDELTLADCSLAALLWRLPQYGVELPTSAKAVNQYADRLFRREGFRASLTEAEREMRG